MDNYSFDQVELPFDYLHDFSECEVWEAKFTNLTTLQTSVFEGSKYKAEEKIKIKNEKGEDVEKNVPIGSYIRFRYDDDLADLTDEVEQAFGLEETIRDKKLVSNARIVEWSDGTHQLVIGDEYFDIMFSNMENTRFGILNEEQNVTVVNKQVKQRMILTPCEYDYNKKERKVTESQESGSKVKLAYSFYDTNEYKKDDFGGKYGAKKSEKNTGKKRRRSVSGSPNN